MHRSSRAAAALVVLTLATGCGGSQPQDAPTETASPVAAPAAASVPSGAASGALAGTEWEALSLNGTAITSAPAPTLSFARNGQVTATGGCNTFTGSVRVGEGGISFPNALAGTRRACQGDLESRDALLNQSLASAASFQTEPGRLTLFDASGAVVGLFVAPL